MINTNRIIDSIGGNRSKVIAEFRSGLMPRQSKFSTT